VIHHYFRFGFALPSGGISEAPVACHVALDASSEVLRATERPGCLAGNVGKCRDFCWFYPDIPIVVLLFDGDFDGSSVWQNGQPNQPRLGDLLTRHTVSSCDTWNLKAWTQNSLAIGTVNHQGNLINQMEQYYNRVIIYNHMYICMYICI